MKTLRFAACLALFGIALSAATTFAADPPKKSSTTAPAADAKKTTDAKKPVTPSSPSPLKEIPTTEPVNRDGARHQTIIARAIPGKVDVLFLGDSITQGWEGAGAAAWDKYFSSLKPMNAGIGGDRTQHVLWRLDNGTIKGIKPKAAVLMIGTNNSGDNTSEEIADGIKAIVGKLRKELPETKILLLAIFPRGADKNDERRKVNEGANKIISKLDDGKMVEFLDIGPKFLAADGTLSKEIMPDLLHLSPEGYEIWASSIIGPLTSLMGVPAPKPTAAASTPAAVPAKTQPTPVAKNQPTPAPARPAPANNGGTTTEPAPADANAAEADQVVTQPSAGYNNGGTRRIVRPGLLRRLLPR
jgi:beta-glucosidase